MRPIFHFLFLLISCQLSAQDCPQGFYVLRNDTIFELSKKLDGQPTFVPYYQADFLDSIGALAYHQEDQYWYGISFDHGIFLKFQTNGRIEKLGRPRHERSGKLMSNKDLSSAVIVDHQLYVLDYAKNSIYAVDLTQSPLTYKHLATFNHRLPNSLSYDARTKRLLVFHQNGGSIYYDLETGQQEVENKKYKGFKRNSFLAYGKLWFDADGEAIMLHGTQGALVNIDLKEKVVYDIAQTGFSSVRDATQCFGAEAPTPFPQDLLRMRVFPYQSGGALQVEWMQGQNHKVLHYELQANRSDGRGWVKLQGLPALNAYQQAGRHAALDRYTKSGEHCYRLRIDYQAGHSRYSASVCMDWPDSLAARPWKISPQLVSSEWPYLELQTAQCQGKLVDTRIYRLIDDQMIFQKVVRPKGEDQSFLLALPKGQGWHRVELISGEQIEQFSVYLNLEEE